MKIFLIKIGGLGLLLLLSMLFVFSMADGRSDTFYKKFTSNKQSSLILGSSRIAQGVIPSVINKELKGVEGYNYAFTYNICPYGITYLNSIKRKLNTNNNNQVFILGVDPWVLSNDSEDPNNIDLFSEKERFLGKVKDVNSNPNIGYLLHAYSEPYVKILFNNASYIVEDDGFLRLSMSFSDDDLKKRKEEVIDIYKDLSKIYRFSTLRLHYLKETISYLKTYGDVYLLRSPIDMDLLNIEKNFMGNFDKTLNDLANEMGVAFFDMSKDGDLYNYSDGHHLMPKSANALSLKIASRIKALKN